MANPTQPNVGFTPERESATPEKNPIPLPPNFVPSAPGFSPPKLPSQQDQASSRSVKTPNVLSPANGVTTGSSVPHLSIPPGPPVFTSPVRPASVPFRTSPASPQPVAFSSVSSLPTSTSSSPLQFSNGSFDLQHQLSDSIDDNVPVGESSFVLFSARKVYMYILVYFNSQSTHKILQGITISLFSIFFVDINFSVLFAK